MSTLIHELSIAPLVRSLKSLDTIVTKAEEHLAANEDIQANTLLKARLFPNMLDFIFQIRVATDTAKGAAARLAGNDVPAWPDEEKTFAQVHERIGKAIDYLAGYEPGDFEGAENLAIELTVGPYTLNFSGSDYIVRFVLPNFYFHVTTAYNILRSNGVVLGKRDYLGADLSTPAPATR